MYQIRDINTLNKLANNPRIIRDDAFQKLCQSLKDNPDYFHARPLILSDRTGELVIIAGNQRYEAAKAIGLPQVPTFLLQGLSEAREKEIVIRDNVNNGEWDYDLLANEWEESELGSWGLEIPQYKIKQTAEEDDYEVPELERIHTSIKPGDLIQIGPHRILCADCTDPRQVDRLMNGRPADMVFTDPPYNVNYSGRGKKTNTTIENDNLPEIDFRVLLAKAFQAYAEHLRPTGALYVCYASATHREFEDELNAAGFQVRNQIIWAKTVASMGWGDYRWKHEPIFYCFRKGHTLNFYGDRKQYTEWSHEPTDQELLAMVKKLIKKEQEGGGTTLWKFSREFNYQHPTQKPVVMISNAVKNSSKRGQLVLDLFSGSASTMVTSHQLGRDCYAMELEPKYCQVAIDRMTKLDPSLQITITPDTVTA
jgi:DNA modification methylase